VKREKENPIIQFDLIHKVIDGKYIRKKIRKEKEIRKEKRENIEGRYFKKKN